MILLLHVDLQTLLPFVFDHFVNNYKCKTLQHASAHVVFSNTQNEKYHNVAFYFVKYEHLNLHGIEVFLNTFPNSGYLYIMDKPIEIQMQLLPLLTQTNASNPMLMQLPLHNIPAQLVAIFESYRKDKVAMTHEISKELHDELFTKDHLLQVLHTGIPFLNKANATILLEHCGIFITT